MIGFDCFFFDYVRFISIQKRIIESRSNVTMHMHNTPHFENHMNLNMNLLTFDSGGIGVINRVIGCMANIISKVKSRVSTKISIDITWYLQSSKIFFFKQRTSSNHSTYRYQAASAHMCKIRKIVRVVWPECLKTCHFELFSAISSVFQQFVEKQNFFQESGSVISPLVQEMYSTLSYLC